MNWNETWNEDGIKFGMKMEWNFEYFFFDVKIHNFHTDIQVAQWKAIKSMNSRKIVSSRIGQVCGNT